MLTEADLDALSVLDVNSTAGPWYVRHLDDNHAMCAIGIATTPDTGRHEDMDTFGDDGPALLAATLIQAPPYVIATDGKWHENAALITAVRTRLPELIELARLELSHRT